MFQPANYSKLAPLAPNPRQGRRISSAGFSIVEIMVVLAVSSIIISIAIPRVKQYQNTAAATVVVNDLRTFEAAFQAYAQEKGTFPAEANPGEMPPEMVGRLSTTGWMRVTPLGGQYNWENNQTHGGTRYRAAICISESGTAPLEVNEERLREIDRIIDDGNLATGNFRTGVNNDALYIILQ